MLKIINKNTPVIDLGCINDIAICFDDDLIVLARRDAQNLKRTWIQWNGKRYFFKAFILEERMIAELLGEKVSEAFSLETVHYQLAKGYIKTPYEKINVCGLISEWARAEDCNYSLLIKVLQGTKVSPMNVNILNVLEEKYANHPIVNQFKGFLVRELFTKETDRLPGELVIKETNSHFISLGYLLDYEYEFSMREANPRIKADDLYGLSFTDIDFQKKIKKDEVLKEYINLAKRLNLLEMLKILTEEYQLRLFDGSSISNNLTNHLLGFEKSQKLAFEKNLTF